MSAVVSAQGTGLQSQPLHLVSVHVAAGYDTKPLTSPHISKSSHNKLIRRADCFLCGRLSSYVTAVFMYILLFTGPALMTGSWEAGSLINTQSGSSVF